MQIIQIDLTQFDYTVKKRLFYRAVCTAANPSALTRQSNEQMTRKFRLLWVIIDKSTLLRAFLSQYTMLYYKIERYWQD